MRETFLVVSLAIVISACGSGSNESTDEPDNTSKIITQKSRVFICEVDANPLIGCWTVELCVNRYPLSSTLNVYAKFSYAFEKSGDLVHRYLEYDNASCNGTATKVIDDTRVSEVSASYQDKAAKITLEDGLFVDVFKVYYPNDSTQSLSNGFVAYNISNGRLCVSTDVITGKSTPNAFEISATSIDDVPGIINYTNCMIRDNE